MKIIRHNNAKDFYTKVKKHLIKYEALNNLPIGIILSAFEKSFYDDQIFAYIENNSEIEIILIKTIDRLVLYSENPPTEQSCSILSDFLIDEDFLISGVIGPSSVIKPFNEIWRRKKNCSIKLTMNQGIYKLQKLNPIKISEGNLRLAEKNDINTISKWIIDFSEEALEKITHKKAYELAENSIDNKRLFLWEYKNNPVSMAKKTRPTENGYAINLVYTPKKFRNQGFASSCVSKLSEKILNEGYKFTSLYTDMSNKTSNGIYKKIGYKYIGDSVVFDFIYK
ncbi:GNAT family N-acetyltransferase [Oceanotoga sp. DSM 15011]|uniref:GNAT family N-acetyltransferase n=1 Tax=Oceanotoga sp. DSM 15011 TaxID=2984951 RepID=UPI0021F40485|nr:GNAT family N-acetyltransferase [Oceanotoga sp. DSM 15011]UYO99770.1 GNAT family N-acetyltransferase [Oceanotoga sp. DSM 15011]